MAVHSKNGLLPVVLSGQVLVLEAPREGLALPVVTQVIRPGEEGETSLVLSLSWVLLAFLSTRSLHRKEKKFDKLQFQERSKFSTETLANVDGKSETKAKVKPG
ncbi:DUF1517 domain-containing protein [Lusitaniella coriacea LEGE 07157]|uniref:DUF1517 domain-containing protein n=1 Tax=Lusitaniella coriacea LEGE 07157 TaxID=945747 RepID=A0A8J7JDW8_9CYAN|nr:DUF1517 domain-containing protein [Lusitaniella coriacea]MBE9118080.1 DUF1517 domain-containing protein [Lusitaniella coriacea LEGE 07157]